MRRIYAYFISIVLFLSSSAGKAQDTVLFPLKIRAGFDISGPIIYLTDENNMNFEGHISVDRNEKMSYVVEGGMLDYKYSQYNYDYLSKGIFTKIGVDFNLLKPEKSIGKYWAGIGLRYGLSIYKSETTSFQHENYWGLVSSSVPLKTSSGHFIELVPGVRTELFRNFSLGWNIRLKLLISGGGGRDLKPIYFPGYGNGDKRTAAGISYYLMWNIPYKTRTVITKPDLPDESEEIDEQVGNVNNTF
jgi:hypothetical protein